MLKCSQSEGCWFDVLAILNVKLEKLHGIKRTEVFETYQLLEKEIKAQIGVKLFNDIFQSNEYVELYEANLEVFNLVDKAKKNEVTAKDIDDGNFRRFKCKQELQKKFFTEPLKEIKIGY